jgi:hypothetical protein
MLTSTDQHLTERPAAEARASKITGGKYGRVPSSLVAPTSSDTHLSPESTALIAYRSLHADQKRAWGCGAGKMAQAFRKGFGRKIFQRAIREAKDSGYLVRRQGTLKRPNADRRGRGFAVDRLTFGRPEDGYVIVDRHLFDGHLTPSEVTISLFLRARGSCPTMPWQVAKRLGRRRSTGGLKKASRGTVNAVMKTLSSRGIARNHGTCVSPLWAHATVQNATLKKTTRKKSTLKKTTLLRTTSPVRQISPARHEPNNHKGLSPQPFWKIAGRTDLIAGNAAALTAAAAPPDSSDGSAMQVHGEHLPFSDRALRECHLLDVDLDALMDRYFEAEAKKVAKGKRIADPSRYLVKMAKEERAKMNKVSIEALDGISSPNEWTRGAAYGRAMGNPEQQQLCTAILPDEPQLQRIARDLERSGLVADEIFAKWIKARREGTTRLGYPQYANAMRANAIGFVQRRGVR